MIQFSPSPRKTLLVSLHDSVHCNVGAYCSLLGTLTVHNRRRCHRRHQDSDTRQYSSFNAIQMHAYPLTLMHNDSPYTCINIPTEAIITGSH